MRELWNDGRGELWLLAVPVVFTVQQVIVVTQSDRVTVSPLALIGYLAVVWLCWMAAEHRSSRAWEVLIVLAALSFVLSLLALLPDGSPELFTYALLAGVALGLLLAPSVLDHVRGR